MAISTANTDTKRSAPIQITESAMNELKKIISEEGLSDDLGLRIGVKGGGCAGLSYTLGFDQKNTSDDEYELNGLRVFMNSSHNMYLVGMEIDYHIGLENRGFIFNNPNADNTCGCGSSFA